MSRRILYVCLFLVAASSHAGAADSRARRESLTRNRLQTLLSPFGMAVDAPEPAPRAWRHVSFDWSRADRVRVPARREMAADRRLAIVGERRSAAAPARRRGLQLSEHELLVVALDSTRRVKSWTAVADPRVVRYETADEAGRLVDGGTVYRSDVRFHVEIPDDPAIGEVQIFHPRWNGQAFELESLAAAGRTAR
jgi:hypothetical protein